MSHAENTVSHSDSPKLQRHRRQGVLEKGHDSSNRHTHSHSPGVLDRIEATHHIRARPEPERHGHHDVHAQGDTTHDSKDRDQHPDNDSDENDDKDSISSSPLADHSHFPEGSDTFRKVLQDIHEETTRNDEILKLKMEHQEAKGASQPRQRKVSWKRGVVMEPDRSKLAMERTRKISLGSPQSHRRNTMESEKQKLERNRRISLGSPRGHRTDSPRRLDLHRSQRPADVKVSEG